jgi:hypothetical protein
VTSSRADSRSPRASTGVGDGGRQVAERRQPVHQPAQLDEHLLDRGRQRRLGLRVVDVRALGHADAAGGRSVPHAQRLERLPRTGHVSPGGAVRGVQQRVGHAVHRRTDDDGRRRVGARTAQRGHDRRGVPHGIGVGERRAAELVHLGGRACWGHRGGKMRRAAPRRREAARRRLVGWGRAAEHVGEAGRRRQARRRARGAYAPRTARPRVRHRLSRS